MLRILVAIDRSRNPARATKKGRHKGGPYGTSPFPNPGRLVDRLERAVSLHRDAQATAGFGKVVPHGQVLYATVVPHRHRVLSPPETALEPRLGDVGVEEGQDRVAFVLGNPA